MTDYVFARDQQLKWSMMIVAAAAGLAAIALLAAAGDRFRCSVVKQGERILGFLISIADGDTAIAYHIGFDREAAQGLPVYLRLLHAGIADGIDLEFYDGRH